MPIGEIQNQNDTPIGGSDYRPPVDSSIEPNDGDILVYSLSAKAFFPQEGVTTSGFTVTDDAGNGTVEGDTNATDFSSQAPSVGQAAELKIASVNTFVHKTVAYNWVGPTGVTVGIGGNYVASASDFVSIGTADHTLLVNLVAPDQHPPEAIVGLVDKQVDQDTATALVQTNLDDHAAAPDPHPQYALETAVLENFVGAGYGGIGQNANTALPDIGAGWITYTGFDTTLLASPRYVVQDFANNAIIFNRAGVWQLTVKLSLAFTELNAGREINLRFYNITDNLPTTTTFSYGVGRNTAVANLNVPAIVVDIEASSVGKQFVIQLGNTSDLFTSVVALGGYFSVVHVSEFQEL